MACLVDTDVLIDVAKNNQGAIEFLDSLKEPWSVSIITAMEFLVGARDKKETVKIDQFLSAIAILPLSSAVGETAYRLLKEFARSD